MGSSFWILQKNYRFIIYLVSLIKVITSLYICRIERFLAKTTVYNDIYFLNLKYHVIISKMRLQVYTFMTVRQTVGGWTY